jgi:Holliday junction DNA helicase RuvA
MIGYLSGTVQKNIDDSLLINVQGVGYLVFVSETTKTIAETREHVSLWIHTIVREQSFDLYGFEQENQLYFFKKLLDVSGIGPKSALTMIGLASTDTLYQAILSENYDFLSSVPGIGKKTAERMCIELRDKLKDYQGKTTINEYEEDSDVVDALLALGYRQAEVHQALSEVGSDIKETKERIKKALLIINTK